LVDILTFDGFFGTKFDILKPRGSVSLSVQIDVGDMMQSSDSV